LKCAIFGAGGHGRVVLDCLLSGGADMLGFFDDDPGRRGELVNGVPVLGGFDDLVRTVRKEECGAIVAIGDNGVRRRLQEQVTGSGMPLISAVHAKAAVSAFAEIGEGCVVMPGCCVNANAVIGPGCIINTAATIDHDCVLEGFIHVCPGVNLAGAVRVGAGTFIGAGATVIPSVSIGARAVVGAGAVVVRDVPTGAVCYGVPAKARPAADAPGQEPL